MSRVLPVLSLVFLASCSETRYSPLERSSAPSAEKEAPASGAAAPAKAPDRSEYDERMQDLGYTEETPTHGAASPPADAAEIARLKSLGYIGEGRDRDIAPNPFDKAPKGRFAEPVDEWGGRVFLSNDDTMSLASAQRVLWSVANGERVAPSELRPHELLNYFTFERPPLAEGETFGVSASAIRTGEGLSLALTVTGTTPPRRPLDLTLLVDRSGSMSDEGRIDYVKRGLVAMLDRVRPGDRVSVVLFDDEVDVVKTNFVVGKDDLDDLELIFEEIRPSGGTDLDEGLRAAYAVARTNASRDKDRDHRVLVVTDARLTSGDVNADRITEIGRAFDESGIRLAGVGVGSNFDDAVLQRLTEKGRGAYVYLGSDKVVDRVFGAGFDALVHVVADDVKFALDLPDSLGMQRFYGEEMSTVSAEVNPVSFHAGTTQLFLQDLKVAPTGLVKTDPLVLDLKWRDPLTGRERSQRWTSTVGAALAADDANVTKARALMAWTDLVRVGARGCHAEKREWASRAKTFGGDVETRYLDKLVAGWCKEPESGGMIAEAE